MTPLEMSIALWYHCHVGDYGRGTGDMNFSASAVQDALLRMADAGLLSQRKAGSDQEFYGTAALAVYVDALRKVALPVQQWVIPKDAA